jgi:hypothetical protein
VFSLRDFSTLNVSNASRLVTSLRRSSPNTSVCQFLDVLRRNTISYDETFFDFNLITSIDTINLFLYCSVSVFSLHKFIVRSRDRAVGIATDYGVDGRGVGVPVPVGARIFSSPRRPDWLWCPPNLLSNGYQGIFPRGLSDRGVKLTTDLQLVPRSRKCGSIHPLPHTPSWHSA